MEQGNYSFIVEWFDQMAEIVRPYRLSYFSADHSIEMFDLKNRRIFLKRTEYQGISLSDLFVGAIINVYSRQLRVVDYADECTRRALSVARQRTFALIKPNAYTDIGKIFSAINRDGFSFSHLKMVRMNQRQAAELYRNIQTEPSYRDVVSFVSSDVCVAMELVAENAVEKWNNLIGSQDPSEASPYSLRALYGQDNIRNGLHGADSEDSAQREADMFFNPALPSTATFDNCTLCIIKPHAVASGLSGAIIDAILEQGFEISAMELFHLERQTAEEFLEVYKGVLTEFSAVVDQIISGPCIALEIRAEDAVQTFREFCGPSDVDIAKYIRPNTLRARFGVNKIQNAVHCTDLPEDGILECEYFFRILQLQ